MTTTITNGTTTITPILMDGFEDSAESQTLVHRIIGRSDPDVTFRAATMGAGRASFVFGSDAAAALAARDALREPGTWTLADTDRPEVGMSFVVQGQITRTLDPETRDVWLVGFDWEAVA